MVVAVERVGWAETSFSLTDSSANEVCEPPRLRSERASPPSASMSRLNASTEPDKVSTQDSSDFVLSNQTLPCPVERPVVSSHSSLRTNGSIEASNEAQANPSTAFEVQHEGSTQSQSDDICGQFAPKSSSEPQANPSTTSEVQYEGSMQIQPNDAIKGEGIRSEEKGDLEKDTQMEAPGLKDFLIDTGFAFGFTWATRFVYVRNKNERIFNTSFSRWIDNISKRPVINDEDGFITNFVNHPLFGATAYLYYRAKGHSVWASALGSFIQSTLFEYAVEGLVETPSLIDLIATPAIGTVLGVGMENLSTWLVEIDNPVAKVLGHIVNPTRIFVRNRQVGVLNPLTGTFEFRVPFTISPNKSKAILLSYPFSLEPPISVGKLGGNFEVVNLNKELGDEFIFYSIRLDFSSSNNLYGAYIKVPFGGINDVSLQGDGLSDGFELGNTLIGGKIVIIDSDRLSVSGGFEFTLPTARKDNKDRLKAVVKYRRDFPLFLRKSITATPYISAAVWGRGLSLQGNLGVDLITNADRFEGDSFETRIKYAAVLGMSIPFTGSPLIFTELNAYTLASSRDEKTDLFLTPGIRFGKRYSPGFGLQVPLAGATEDIANVNFILDFQARF